MKKILGAAALALLLQSCDNVPQNSQTKEAVADDAGHSRLVELWNAGLNHRDLVFVNKDRGFLLRCGKEGIIGPEVQDMARKLGFTTITDLDRIRSGTSEASELLEGMPILNCNSATHRLYKVNKAGPGTAVKKDYYYVDFDNQRKKLYQVGCQGLVEALKLRTEQATALPEQDLIPDETNDSTDISCVAGQPVKVEKVTPAFVVECMNADPKVAGPLFHKLATTQQLTVDGTEGKCTQLWEKLVPATFLDLSAGNDPVRVKTLEPLRHLPNLLRLHVTGQAIADFSPIADMEHLAHLELNGNPIFNLNFLEKLHQLNTLKVDQATLTNVAVLSDKFQLQNLHIKGTSIQDLSPLEQLPLISTLDVTEAVIDPLTCPQNAQSVRVRSLCESINRKPRLAPEKHAHRLGAMSEFTDFTFQVTQDDGSTPAGEFLKSEDTCGIFSVSKQGVLKMKSSSSPLPQDLCTVEVYFRTNRGVVSNHAVVRAHLNPKVTAFQKDASNKIVLRTNSYPASAILKAIHSEGSCSAILLDSRHAALPFSCLLNSKGELQVTQFGAALSSSQIQTGWSDMVNDGEVAVVRFNVPLKIDSLRSLEPKTVADEELIAMGKLFSFGSYDGARLVSDGEIPSISSECSIFEAENNSLVHNCAEGLPRANGGPVFADWGGNSYFVGMDLGFDKTNNGQLQKMARAEAVRSLYAQIKTSIVNTSNQMNFCNRTATDLYFSYAFKLGQSWKSRAWYFVRKDDCIQLEAPFDSGEILVHGWDNVSNKMFGDGVRFLCADLGEMQDAEGMICSNGNRRPFSSFRIEKDQLNTYTFTGSGRTNWTGAPLVFGRSYFIQSAWSNGNGGYLYQDGEWITGTRLPEDRWTILSLDGKQPGEEVKPTDRIRLVDLNYDQAFSLGYFYIEDTWAGVSYYRFPNIQTSLMQHWSLEPKNGGSVPLAAGDKVSIKTSFGNAPVRYLEIQGDCTKVFPCVTGQTSPNRNTAAETWRFVE